METIVQKRPEPEKPEPVPPTPPEKPEATPPTPPPPVGPEATPPGKPANNTLAIVSLVLGILGLLSLCVTGAAYAFPAASAICGCFVVLLGLAALITGIIARNQIKATGQSGGGFAMAGLVIGAILLVLLICGGLVIGILALLGPSIGTVFSSINASMK